MESSFIFNGPLGPVRSAKDIQSLLEIIDRSYIMFPTALLRNSLAKTTLLIIDDSFNSSDDLIKEYASLSDGIKNLLSGTLFFVIPLEYRGKNKFLRVDFKQDSGSTNNLEHQEEIQKNVNSLDSDENKHFRWTGFSYPLNIG